MNQYEELEISRDLLMNKIKFRSDNCVGVTLAQPYSRMADSRYRCVMETF